MAHIRYRIVPLDDEIEIRRGDTFELDVSGLSDLTTQDNIWFTVKSDKDDADTAADIQIDDDNGLLCIAGGSPTAAANGDITVTNAVAGELTVTLEAVESAKLTDVGKFYYDIQVLYASGDVVTETRGRAYIIGDVTRATS